MTIFFFLIVKSLCGVLTQVNLTPSLLFLSEPEHSQKVTQK